ncbi:hypothetical protein CEY11_12390 [Candidimonas nitroreducens]|uniref:Uncharacterized protein n=1 Tax=Candidimonas nitroreducens TaxID=683354 RepID=A0A225MFH4_9BURK|nr:hypothetical protein CEY11_12390 [Candidimonas nitroreducens]
MVEFQSQISNLADLAFCYVRPAWAGSCGCKSRHKWITANAAKRNCVRVTERGYAAFRRPPHYGAGGRPSAGCRFSRG